MGCRVYEEFNAFYSKLAALNKADLVSVFATLVYYDPILATAKMCELLPQVTVLALVHSLLECSATSRKYIKIRLKELENEDSETH